jgi:hypothetical protein
VVTGGQLVGADAGDLAAGAAWASRSIAERVQAAT